MSGHGCPVLNELEMREDYGDEMNSPVLSGGDYDISAIRSCGDECKVVAENRRLREALEKDQTGMVAALGNIRNEVKARRWISDGRGDFVYDDERYQLETGYALDAIDKLAEDALSRGGSIIHTALASQTCSEAGAGER